MDSTGSIADEVIADSEGEMDDEEEHPGNRVSQVSAFTLTGQLPGKTTSSISAFTAGPSAIWKQDLIADNTNNETIQRSDFDNFIGTASIADRAKTRQRNLKSSFQSSSTKPNAMVSSNGQLEKQRSNANLSSDILELTSDDDDDELSLRPVKPKPNARPKPKLKVKNKPRHMNNDNTFDVSGTTEISADKSADAIPDPRPRPRPRPLVKRSRTTHESTVPPPPLSPDNPRLLPPSSGSACHGLELPIATSPVRPHLHTSQLPPSDPPPPTLTTVHDEDDLPRIETLPNIDFDGPLSSPSSLFSDLGGTTKKRKRTLLDLDIDELASDGDLGSGQGGFGAGARYDYDNGIAAQVQPHMLPPPATFFAGSSSSSAGVGGRQVPSDLTGEVVDLTTLPSTIVPTGATTVKKVAKAKKSRQKKGDAILQDEDELDDDFDPTGSTKKGKAKPKPKPKAKKGADTKVRQGEGRGQVEVSILSKPRTQKTKEKGKGKEKATAGNKDTFKNREMINDSGDEEDPIQLIPNAKDPAASNAGDGASTNSKGAHMSTSLKTAEISVIASVDATPGDEFRPGKSTSSSSSNRMNKKRKSVIESDDENHEDIQGQRLAPEAQVAKENVIPHMKPTAMSKPDDKPDDKPNIGSPGLFPSLHSRYEIAPRRSSLPMSELIRRANSIPGSPFATPHSRTPSSTARPMKSGMGGTTYSPYLKSSRSFLSRIAPLHPNRRTPPPPPPPPPPKKKTKKELEMEEKWEEELIDSVGISEWTCLADDEKKALRKAKWAKEMGDWDD